MDTMQEQMQILSQLKQLLLVQAFDPVRQLAGFLLTADPTYLPPGQARHLAPHLDRDMLLEELTRRYLLQLSCHREAAHQGRAEEAKHNSAQRIDSTDTAAPAALG